MAPALVERAWRDSSPETIEHDLAALWRELARHGAIARAVMSNLVVFRFQERRAEPRAAAALDSTIDAVIARHPSRLIVIEHDRDAQRTGPPLGAGVGVSVFGPPASQYGVETIVVRSACAEVSLPSIVRHLVRGGLPTSIWWTEDLSAMPPLQSLMTMGRQLVYDSRRWHDVRSGVEAVAPLAEDPVIDLADLNWRRLAPLRQALVHAAPAIGSAVPADAVEIRGRADERALAWLLAGWLASMLRWPDAAWPRMGDAPDEIRLTLAIAHERQPVLKATLDAHRVRTDIRGAAPMTVPIPPEADAEAIAAELRTLARDLGFHGTLAALSRAVACGALR